jgi:hypothetical protein
MLGKLEYKSSVGFGEGGRKTRFCWKFLQFLLARSAPSL